MSIFYVIKKEWSKKQCFQKETEFKSKIKISLCAYKVSQKFLIFKGKKIQIFPDKVKRDWSYIEVQEIMKF